MLPMSPDGQWIPYRFADQRRGDHDGCDHVQQHTAPAALSPQSARERPKGDHVWETGRRSKCRQREHAQVADGPSLESTQLYSPRSVTPPSRVHRLPFQLTASHRCHNRSHDITNAMAGITPPCTDNEFPYLTSCVDSTSTNCYVNFVAAFQFVTYRLRSYF